MVAGAPRVLLVVAMVVQAAPLLIWHATAAAIEAVAKIAGGVPVGAVAGTSPAARLLGVEIGDVK
jgi:hypothetical protein